MPYIREFINGERVLISIVDTTKKYAAFMQDVSECISAISNVLSKYQVEDELLHGYLRDIDKAFTVTYQGGLNPLDKCYIRLRWACKMETFKQLIESEEILKYIQTGMIHVNGDCLFIKMESDLYIRPKQANKPAGGKYDNHFKQTIY